MKKKQAKDFQKVKLKVGKRLPRGQNETDTGFKTKKICFEKKHVPETPIDASLKDMLKALNSRDVNTKYDNLRKLIKYVSNNRDTLPIYFPEILKELNRPLQDNDGKVREEAIELIGQCVDHLTEIQFKSFFIPLTLFMKCMMTRNIPIQLDSLKLLDKLLNSHPKVTCHCSNILINLLNMISRVPHGGFVKESKANRILVDIINKTMSSAEWRMKVLARMQLFMQAFSTNENANDITDDKEVHWDGKEPLFLPLYTNSGTMPAKLDYSWYHQDNSDSNEMKQFVLELAPLLVAILKGDISSAESVSEFHVVKGPVIKSLNIITQLLLSIGEWAHQISSKEGSIDLLTNRKFSVALNNVCYELLKGFPYVPHVLGVKKYTKKDETECMQLNLALCYLYSIFNLNTESASVNLEAKIFSYLKDIYRFSGTLCEKSVTLTLKTSKNIIQSKNTGKSFKDGVILGLHILLEKHKLEPLADKLYSFFMDLSLNYDLKYLLDSEGMSIWFNSLFKDLNFMMESRIVPKKFLKYIEQVCIRRYPPFMQQLNSISTNKLIEFLQFDDEAFQLTIMHLITSLDVMSPDLLQNVAATITHKDFSLKIALRMIDFLHCRFSKSNVSAMDKLQFVKFLLNVGCDALCSVKPDPNPEELLPLSDSIMETEQNCMCSFEVYPLSISKNYMKIFEVCFERLIPYLRSKIVAHSILFFMKSICFEIRKFPVHSVIGIMEIRNRLNFLAHDERLNTLLNEVCFTSMVYMSYVTNAALEEDWDDYLLPQLQNSLSFLDGKIMIQIIEQKFDRYGKGEVFLILRVIYYLFKRTNVMSQNKNLVYEFLDIIGGTCRQDHTLGKMWMDLCKIE